MKLLIDMPKEKYEWIKTHNLNIDNDSIVGAVANGIPYEEDMMMIKGVIDVVISGNDFKFGD